MIKNFLYKNYQWLCLIIVLTLLDIGTKFWIQTYFPLEISFRVFFGINCYYTRNAGLAFGLFSNMSVYYRWIFLWITIFIIIMFTSMLFNSVKYSFYNNLSYSMIIGGALGNLYDRMLYGSVVDFIDLHIGIWHWPIFNIADVEICIGIIMLIIKFCFYENKKDIFIKDI